MFPPFPPPPVPTFAAARRCKRPMQAWNDNNAHLDYLLALPVGTMRLDYYYIFI